MSAVAPAWSRADLARRLCQALDVAEQAVMRLAAEGYVDAIDPAQSVRAEKVVSETGVLLLAAAAVQAQPTLTARLDHLARLLIPHARGPRMWAGICFEPALALDYAQAHACLRRMGHADPSFDALVSAATRSQAFAVRERTPHRALEQRWVAELCGVEGSLPFPSHRALAPMSALGKPLDLLGGSREDLYAFTHALMYVTDAHLPPKRLPRRRTDILADGEAALSRCIDEEDYDLAGELLLAWPLTHSHWSATAAFAFQTLAQVEDEAGFLPSAGTKLKHLDRLAGQQRSDCLVASAYHTVYVMGLLCAASLAPGRAPPTRLRAAPRMAALADAAHAALDAGAKVPHWSQAYTRLAPAERGALAGFVLGVALRHAVRRRDLAAVHDLLRRAAGAGTADGPLWSQAAELLERAAVRATRPTPRAGDRQSEPATAACK
jgi:hypothetical protein